YRSFRETPQGCTVFKRFKEQKRGYVPAIGSDYVYSRYGVHLVGTYVPRGKQQHTKIPCRDCYVLVNLKHERLSGYCCVRIRYRTGQAVNNVSAYKDNVGTVGQIGHNNTQHTVLTLNSNLPGNTHRGFQVIFFCETRIEAVF